MTWGHYRFRMRLMTKAREYQCLVHEVTEEYTSQGVANAGHGMRSEEARPIYAMRVDSWRTETTMVQGISYSSSLPSLRPVSLDPDGIHAIPVRSVTLVSLGGYNTGEMK